MLLYNFSSPLSNPNNPFFAFMISVRIYLLVASRKMGVQAICAKAVTQAANSSSDSASCMVRASHRSTGPRRARRPGTGNTRIDTSRHPNTTRNTDSLHFTDKVDLIVISTLYFIAVLLRIPAIFVLFDCGTGLDSRVVCNKNLSQSSKVHT